MRCEFGSAASETDAFARIRMGHSRPIEAPGVVVCYLPLGTDGMPTLRRCSS